MSYVAITVLACVFRALATADAFFIIKENDYARLRNRKKEYHNQFARGCLSKSLRFGGAAGADTVPIYPLAGHAALGGSEFAPVLQHRNPTNCASRQMTASPFDSMGG